MIAAGACILSLSAQCAFAQFEDLPRLEQPATTRPTAKSSPSQFEKQRAQSAFNPGTSKQATNEKTAREKTTHEKITQPATFDEVFQITHPNAQALLDSKPRFFTPRVAQRPDRQNQVSLPVVKPVDNSAFVPAASNRPQGKIRIVQQDEPTKYQPWWLKEIAKHPGEQNSDQVRQITVDQLVIAMLQYSPEIRALSQEPLIASTYVDVEDASFDPITFLESKWEDTNEPVGNTLTTNLSPFLKDHIVTAKAGFRRKSRIGTEVELAQNLGFKNSNSEFFVPQDQGTARLELNVNQPLLNGAGRLVGTSKILLAEIDTDVTESQYAEKLQERILGVIRAYWELYYQKSVWILRQQNLESAKEILRQLRGRESFDAQRSQIIRAEAAVAARKLDLVRSRTDVRNAETVIRELTRDPGLGKLGVTKTVELLPTEFPQVNEAIFPDLPAVVSVAYHNRPEINQAMDRLKAASIQNDVSKNQLLPQLNFIMSAYSAALNGESGVLEAWNRQFIQSTPGYSAGLTFEYPLYNRAAQARVRRIEAQMSKLSSELDDTMGSITAEVEIAHRELKMALEATAESEKSIEAAEKDQTFIQKRWLNFAFLENQDVASPTIFLEQLLDAQDRITQAQIQYAGATRQFMIAIAELRKAEGSLLNYQDLAPEAAPQKGLEELVPQPELKFEAN